MNLRTGLNARGKIDRQSDTGDSYTQGLVRVCGVPATGSLAPLFSLA